MTRSTSGIAPRGCAATSTTRWWRRSSTACQEVWPGCVIQWEDFKNYNALRILEQYRHRVPSFNDDIQGTAVVVVAGVLAALRAQRASIADVRVLLVGAGAAGIGIARLLSRKRCATPACHARL